MLMTKDASVDVLTAAKQRIRNVFSNGIKVYLSFSCGKDSLVMSSLTYDLIMNGDIDKDLLTVVFFDEEGIYPEMEEAAYTWREKFERIGVPFLWFCLPFAQASVIDNLSTSESWITWDPAEKDKWIRTPPDFAIMDSPYLHYPGEMNYQTFSRKAFNDGICMIGIRTAESLTRIRTLANTFSAKNATNKNVYPIYDWKDSDIWLYIKEHNLKFPEIYIRMYEAGTKRNHLRLCAFFGDHGINGILHIAETNPDLWNRILIREPNAYLATMYWDSEMFRRSTKKRRELEADMEQRDYRELMLDLLFKNTEKYNVPKGTIEKLYQWKNLFMKSDGIATNDDYQKMYEAILYGDPKSRSLRILYTDIFGRGMEQEKRRTT